MKRMFRLAILTIYILIFILFYFAVLNPALIPSELLRSNTGEVIYQRSDNSLITVKMSIIPLDINDQDYQAFLKINELSYYANEIPESTINVCVDSLVIMLNGNSKVWGGSETHRFLFDEKKCSEIEKENYDFIDERMNYYYIDNFIPGNESDKFQESLYLENDPIFYPYDGFQIQASAFITVSYIDNNGIVINRVSEVPDLLINYEAEGNWDRLASKKNTDYFWKNWSIGLSGNVRITEDSYLPLIENGIPEPTVIMYTRPKIIRYTFPIVILSFIILNYLLVDTRNLTHFFEGSIAVLVGLFGIRELFIPTTFTFNTLVDFSVILIYSLFAFSIFVQFCLYLFGYYNENESNRLEKNNNGVVIDVNKSIKDEQISKSVDESLSFNKQRNGLIIIFFVFILWLIKKILNNKK